MPTTAGTTARGLPYPGDTGALPDGPAAFKALADAVELLFDGPLIWGGTLTVPRLIVSGTEAVVDLIDTDAGANVKRSRVRNAGGVTSIDSVDDAYTTAVQRFTLDHSTGAAAFSGDVTVGDDLAVVGDATVGGLAVGVGAFSGYRSAALSVATGADIPFDTQEFDTANVFDPATGLVALPVGEVWRLSWRVGYGVNNGIRADLYRGSSSHRMGGTGTGSGSVTGSSFGSSLVAGHASAFKVVLTHNGAGSQALTVGADACYLQGERVG